MASIDQSGNPFKVINPIANSEYIAPAGWWGKPDSAGYSVYVETHNSDGSDYTTSQSIKCIGRNITTGTDANSFTGTGTIFGAHGAPFTNGTNSVTVFAPAFQLNVTLPAGGYAICWMVYVGIPFSTVSAYNLGAWETVNPVGCATAGTFEGVGTTAGYVYLSGAWVEEW